MLALISLLAVAESPGQDDGGLGIGIILLTLLLVIVVIAGIWTFAAKRGSKIPKREPHKRDHVGS